MAVGRDVEVGKGTGESVGMGVKVGVLLGVAVGIWEGVKVGVGVARRATSPSPPLMEEMTAAGTLIPHRKMSSRATSPT